ncbi:MAG: CinA family protein [Ruminococcus sp.]|nr:CinA family protein [Ruminococcus sp.]
MSGGNYTEYGTRNLDKTVTNVVKLLEKDRLTIAAAESCTGGLLSELITSVSGASAVFELGICTYSERMKTQFLGVSPELIGRCGVVSAEVAESMARGLKERSGADICVSVTGIAGPGGGTPDKPVGTVFIGFCIKDRFFVRLAELWKLPDLSRENIRRSAAAFAFGVIEEALTEANYL